jgi:hypothetical protein
MKDWTPSVKIQSSATPELDRAFSYALTGCHRVETLVKIYNEARAARDKSSGKVFTHLSDVLRGAVMLCHAHLEQLLRDLIYLEADRKPEFLKKIPLPGSDHKRAERFSLAELASFQDQSISKLIDTAVRESLSKRSFTTVEDVVWVLKSCELGLDEYKEFFPSMSTLMDRRHHIAHTADLDTVPGRGKQITRSLSAKSVRDWNSNIQRFILRLKTEVILLRDLDPKSRKEARFSAKIQVKRVGRNVAVIQRIVRTHPPAKTKQLEGKK